jgi:DnaJ-class molecular chaperone
MDPIRSKGFMAEDCACCKGQGVVRDREPCSPCRGKGKVLVVEPSIPCPRCKGTGETERNSFWSSSDHCVVCFGTGWSRTEYHFL